MLPAPAIAIAAPAPHAAASQAPLGAIGVGPAGLGGRTFGESLSATLAQGVQTGAQNAQSGFQSMVAGGAAGVTTARANAKSQVAAFKTQLATQPLAAANQAATALAGLQNVVQNAQAQVSTVAAAGLGGIIQQASTATAGGAGAAQVRLASLTQQLNRLEARTTGVDPTAPPAGWTEPPVFAQARGLLNSMLGGTTPASAAAQTSGDPLAMAGLPIPGQTAQTTSLAQSATAQPLAVAPANPAAPGQPPAADASAGPIAAAAEAAQATVAIGAPQFDPLMLKSAAGAAPAPLSAPTGAPGSQSASNVSRNQTASSGSGAQNASGAQTASSVPLAPVAQDKPGDHADTLDSQVDAQAQAQADAAQAKETAESADQAARPAAATDVPADAQSLVPLQTQAQVQAQTQAQAQAATAPPLPADPSHAGPQATSYLAAQMVKQLNGRSTQFDLELHPADLGRVDVQMRIEQDGRLNAQLAFDNPAAAAEFRGRSDELKQQLQQAGFQVSDDSLSFTDRNAQSFGQGFGQGSGATPDQGASRFRDTETTVQAADAALAQPSRTVLGLDMRV